MDMKMPPPYNNSNSADWVSEVAVTRKRLVLADCCHLRNPGVYENTWWERHYASGTANSQTCPHLRVRLYHMFQRGTAAPKTALINGRAIAAGG